MAQPIQVQPDIDRQAERETETRAYRRALLISAGIILTFYVLNALSIGTELRWSGRAWPDYLPWVQEGSAILPMLVALPVVLWLGQRFPFERGRLAMSLAVHATGLLAYGLFQIAVMFTLRDLIWPSVYGFAYTTDGTMLDVFVYEFRKQALAYVGFQFILSTDMALERARMEAGAAATEAQTRHRITLKCGGRVLLLEAEGFECAQAASNYVETRFAGRTHLARMTLAQLECLLAEAGINPVRVHRSWLVNRDRIREIAPTGEGDVTITLDTGATIPGSRRYRDRLGAG